MTRNLILAAMAALALSACNTTGRAAPEPRIITQEVKVPVPVPCVVDRPAEPVWPDTDEALAAAPGLYERVQLLVAGRLLRIADRAQWVAASSACAS